MDSNHLPNESPQNVTEARRQQAVPATAEGFREVPAAEKGKTKARFERVAGLILLGLAVLAIVGAVLAVINASRGADGSIELAGLAQLAAVFLGIFALVFLTAALGVLSGTTWGRRFGLVVSGLVGALGSWLVLSSPAPWDHSANLGIYEPTIVDWLLSLTPPVACWIVVVALLRAGRIPEAT